MKRYKMNNIIGLIEMYDRVVNMYDMIVLIYNIIGQVGKK